MVSYGSRPYDIHSQGIRDTAEEAFFCVVSFFWGSQFGLAWSHQNVTVRRYLYVESTASTPNK